MLDLLALLAVFLVGGCALVGWSVFKGQAKKVPIGIPPFPAHPGELTGAL